VSGIKEKSIGNTQSVKKLFGNFTVLAILILIFSKLEKVSVGLFPMLPGLRKKKAIPFREFSIFVHFFLWYEQNVDKNADETLLT
jgi:hypothetical protein